MGRYHSFGKTRFDKPRGVGGWPPYSLNSITGLLVRQGGPISPIQWPHFSDTVALKLREGGLLSPIFEAIATAQDPETVATFSGNT